MDLEIVFNELSLQTPAGDVETARQWMSELIETVRAATAKGVPGMLRTKSNFYSSELARNYTVSKWFKERDKDLEARLLKSYIRKGWNLDQITELNIQVRDRGEQGETEQSIGLAYAVINRLTPLAWRIHFFPDVGPGRMIIGYIGKHLPTVKYPN